jgi:hypothetical protein
MITRLAAWLRPSRRRAARLVAACLAVAAVWACGPVYIPVPPPGQASFTAQLLVDDAGVQHTFWIAAGGPEPAAADGTYFVFDDTRAAGVFTDARSDGSFEAPPFEGAVGDRVLVYYEDRVGKRSASACLLLSELRPPERCR